MRGFTLLESLIYIVLFGIVMSAAFTSVAALTESADRNETKAFLFTEGAFLIGKIEYANSLSQPVPNLETLTSAAISNHSDTGFTLSATTSDGQVVSEYFTHE